MKLIVAQVEVIGKNVEPGATIKYKHDTDCTDYAIGRVYVAQPLKKRPTIFFEGFRGRLDSPFTR
jgi:hypothetical protein